MATKKITYEYVKNYIAEMSNGECDLISTEYINCSSPLTLKCKCGNIFYKSFDKLKNGFFVCKDCLNKIRSEKYRKDFKSVVEYINNTGCEYVSGDYINSNSLLTIRCKCGNLFKKNYNHFKRGQQQCPKCGAESSRQSKFKYNIESVREILSKKGYTLLDDEYVNCTVPLKCVCSRGHEVNIIFNQFLAGCSGCSICAYINNSGENSILYKGGESEVLEDLRKSLKEWKLSIMKKYNYRCCLTNSRRDLVVHHLKPFKKIVEECCHELNLPLHRKFKDYTVEEHKSIKLLVLKKHTEDIGIVLQRKVHSKFHRIYGVKNNTIEQFNEFIKKYYPNQNPIPTFNVVRS